MLWLQGLTHKSQTFSTGLNLEAIHPGTVLDSSPLRRVGEPHEIASVVVKLVGPADALLSEHNLFVDDGTTINGSS
jgi:NAD(P)-dependent dehydrogenase (short-subunit alcohol dehydrogenase family)